MRLELLERRTLPGFIAPFTYGTGVNPNALAIGDVNGDGVPDLVTADYGVTTGYGGTVSVLLGNGDGRPDVVAANFNSYSVAVLLNDANWPAHPGAGARSPRPADLGSRAIVLPVFPEQPPSAATLAGPRAPVPAPATLEQSVSPDQTAVDRVFAAPLERAGKWSWIFQTRRCRSRAIRGRTSSEVRRAQCLISLSVDSTTLDLADCPGVVGLKTSPSVFSWMRSETMRGVYLRHRRGERLSLFPGYARAVGKHRTNQARPALEILEKRIVPSFILPTTYPTAHSPAAVVVADFNRDGVPDIATANGADNLTGPGTVSILLGNGDGSFRPHQDYSVGAGPLSLAVGDFNGDGIPDLVTGNYSDDDISVLLGNGDGSFRDAGTYAVGVRPGSVAVGDFTGDGRLDLAVANVGVISILLGNGDGTFQPAVKYYVGGWLTSVAVGDFTGNGILDLAATDYGRNTVDVLLGNGDGTFQPYIPYSVGWRPHAVVVGDFNGDGFADLAVANSALYGGTPSVSVLLGNGDGTFRPQVTFATDQYPYGLAAGDFTGSGVLDLVTANATDVSEDVSVLLGNGDGTFGPPMNYRTGTEFPDSVAVADVNGDGLPDLVVSSDYWIGTLGGVTILFNDGHWPTAADGLSPNALPKESVPATGFSDQDIGPLSLSLEPPAMSFADLSTPTVLPATLGRPAPEGQMTGRRPALGITEDRRMVMALSRSPVENLDEVWKGTWANEIEKSGWWTTGSSFLTRKG
jgi:hypothetical protein